ncbi:MAG TPA: hypothetical protein VJ761_12710, partial [Ktedonobacteraceae bacterium]|nr:hypothetical protein [Ktedonobacteraceae bacterium]
TTGEGTTVGTAPGACPGAPTRTGTRRCPYSPPPFSWKNSLGAHDNLLLLQYSIDVISLQNYNLS